LYLWERDHRRPRRSSLERVAAVLGVKLEYLQAGTPSVANRFDKVTDDPWR
jgi:transcriptional regulator with XRE-family HTH domain